MNLGKSVGALFAAIVVVTASGPVLAGPGDSPIPSISGADSTRSLFVVPGVIKNNGLETAFMCTLLESGIATVAVEVFAPEGGGPLNNVSSGVGNGTLTVTEGATVTISTGSSTGLHEDLAITGLANVKNGSARILATSSRVLCTAILVEKNGATPATIATLKVFSRRKQNGD